MQFVLQGDSCFAKYIFSPNEPKSVWKRIGKAIPLIFHLFCCVLLVRRESSAQIFLLCVAGTPPPVLYCTLSSSRLNTQTQAGRPERYFLYIRQSYSYIPIRHTANFVPNSIDCSSTGHITSILYNRFKCFSFYFIQADLLLRAHRTPSFCFIIHK